MGWAVPTAWTDAFGVHDQPEQDYGAPPVGERQAGQAPAPDLDDPYRSH
ncbi:hypothetical protein ABTY61_18315 [Kitasatospora sp. NPDC096128]